MFPENLTRKEKAEATILALLGALLAGELFYRTAISVVLVPFAMPFVFRAAARGKEEKRRLALRNGFRDYLYAVSSSAGAGKSLPAALGDAARSVALLYGGDAPVRVFAERVRRELRETEAPATAVLRAAAEDSGVPEIRTFGEICTICTETGGDLAAAIGKTEALLSARIETEKRIESGLAEKKLELRILVAMPLMILAFLQFSSADYMRVLYESGEGRLVMTVALAAMIGAVVWTGNMMRTILG